MDTIRVVVVDDHPLFLEGVVKCLDDDPSFVVVGQGASAMEALQLCVDTLPDIVLLDVNMQGNGIVAVKNISQACPIVRICMLTMSENDNDVVQSFQAGAHGYIIKGVSGSELIAAAKSLHDGELYLSPGLAGQLMSMTAKTDVQPANKSGIELDRLTAREEQILEGIAKGLSNREIGEQHNLAEKTVKNYVTNILQKLHVRNRVEAAILARERGTT